MAETWDRIVSGMSGCEKRIMLILVVRVSAKELTSLILDEERLRTERSDRKSWKSRVTGIDEYGPQGTGGYPGGSDSEPRRKKPERRERAQRPDEEDAEYRLAIEASKHEAEEDKKRRESKAAPPDDDDLAKAIKLSKEEEELRRRELEESNANSLFDDSPASSNQPQNTGYNQGYQQQSAVDWFGNPVDPQAQQAQNTGFLNNAYTQPQQTGFQPQQTGYQNGFQPQQTGFDPSHFQQQQQQANFVQPQSTVQPQQTAFPNYNNPYAQQQNDFGSQFQQQQQQQPVSPTVQAGSHNPWATNQQAQADALKPAATGSNNPFASSFNRPQPQQQQSGPPTLSSLAEQRTATQFGNQSTYNPIQNYSAPQAPHTPQAPQKPVNPQHERLNALLASGEGMDTFGNTGETRIPSQHTAPGQFVNSAGVSRLQTSQTGNNPFFSQQFTGAPQSVQGGYGTSQQQPQQQIPAATGPANFGTSHFGQQNNNPFGAQQHQQQQRFGGGSLIDL